MSLTKEDQKLVREARSRKGIPTRTVASVLTKRKKPKQTDDAMDVDDNNNQQDKVPPSLLKSPPPSNPSGLPPLPAGILKPPSIGALKTSQRDATYSKKKPPPNGGSPGAI